jgi:hypothetical protein
MFKKIMTLLVVLICTAIAACVLVSMYVSFGMVKLQEWDTVQIQTESKYAALDSLQNIKDSLLLEQFECKCLKNEEELLHIDESLDNIYLTPTERIGRLIILRGRMTVQLDDLNRAADETFDKLRWESNKSPKRAIYYKQWDLLREEVNKAEEQKRELDRDIERFDKDWVFTHRDMRIN